MDNQSNKTPENESVRLAMELAWRDHHHARDQTWKAVQMVAVLGAGFVTVEVQFHNFIATVAAGSLVIFAALFAMAITRNHRKLERRKFIHIMNCEEWLGLHRDDLIPLKKADSVFLSDKETIVKDSAVSVPIVYNILEAFDPRKHNTSLFIFRILIAIIALISLFVSLRWTLYSP